MSCKFALASLLSAASLSGCASPEANVAASQGFAADDTGTGDRVLIRSASIALECADPGKAAADAGAIVAQEKGFVQECSTDEKGGVEAVYRVPEAALDDVLKAFSRLGDVTRQNVTARDVTAEVADLDARLKNLVATRDSFRQLIEKSTTVKDTVLVEQELSRVQGEIDALEARLKVLRSQAAMSQVRLSIRRSRILGPVGLVAKGVWWLVSKLFVIRD